MSNFLDKKMQLRLARFENRAQIYEIATDIINGLAEKEREIEKLKQDIDFLDKQNLELIKKIDRREREITELEQNLRLQKEYNKQVIDPDCMLTIK